MFGGFQVHTAELYVHYWTRRAAGEYDCLNKQIDVNRLSALTK